MNIARQWHEGGHAIVQASFAVEFDTPPSSATIRELLALHSKVKEKYPRRQETYSQSFAVPTAGVDVPQIGQRILSGFNFDSLKPDGNVERAITMNGKMLTVNRYEYIRWHITWPEVRAVYELMLPIALEKMNVEAFHLQYFNRFIWIGDTNIFRAEKIFRKGSKFLASNVFDVPELWHCNHGFFQYLDEPSKHQLLSIADVQVVLPERVGAEAPAEWGLVAEVRLNHRVVQGVERAGGRTKSAGTVEEVLATGDGKGLLACCMDEMHERNNWLMARLINDDVCDMIKLPKPE